MLRRARAGVPGVGVGGADQAWQGRFWGGRAITAGAMGPFGVVVAAPPLDPPLGLSERVEHLAVEQFVAPLAVEALIVALLPGAAAVNEQRSHAKPAEPGRYDLGGERRAIVRPDGAGGACSTNRSVSACSTSSEVRLRATAMARHSRVYSASTVSLRKGLPSGVRSCPQS
jgi:hypothetical protein